MIAKTLAWNVCRYFGINRWGHMRLRHQLLVLCYHGVVAEPKQDRFRYSTTVSVAEFDAHLHVLRTQFSPISMVDLLAWYEGRSALPDYPVLVTFDDGYRNNLTMAAPVLRSHNIPCVFHMTTGYIGTDRMLWTDEVVSRILQWPKASVPTPDGGEVHLPVSTAARRQLARQFKERCKQIAGQQAEEFLASLRHVESAIDQDPELFRFLNWNEVRELRRQGFEIGSHTVEHPILTHIPKDRLAFEMAESRRQIEEQTGEAPLAIAYPNGGRTDFSADVMQAARAAGYRLGFTIVEEFNQRPENPLAVYRLCVMGHLPQSSFDFRVNGTSRLLTNG